MRLTDLKTPLNKKTLIGKSMLFARMPIAILLNGEATIEYNILNGNYFVSGQKNSLGGYFISSINNAIGVAKTINHYNKTNEVKKFKTNNIKELSIQM